jgi:hypothetical protein
MPGIARYCVKKSSWLAPLCTAPFLAIVALLLGALAFMMPVGERALGALVFVCALAIAVTSAWLVWVGVHTRRCSASLTADGIDLTAFRLINGRGTRRLASARIAWEEVQSLVTENYDLVGISGFRMELRNLFLFTRRGDFALYGYAWQDWASLVADIERHSAREPDVPAAERSADIGSLRRHMRRNYRAVRVMSWLSLALIVLIVVATWSAAP